MGMAIDPSLKTQFQEDGYVLVPSLLPREEALRLRDECHSLAERLSKLRNIDATWGAAKDVAMGAMTQILHCHDVQYHSALLAKLILDPRFTDVAAELIGTNNIQLHHTKMFIKPAEKGSPFPMHQDKPFFPHRDDSMIAAIFHFDDAPLEKGCLRVMPGTHKSDLPHNPEGGWHLDPAEYPVEDAVPVPAKAGDVIFFHYRCVHGSGLNVSDEARTTILVQMRDPEDEPTEVTHISRGQGLMLHGIDPTGTAKTFGAM